MELCGEVTSGITENELELDEAIKILKNLLIKSKLKLNNFLYLSTKNKTIALNHEDIVVAIGIIKKPISLKKTILIKIFNKTETKEM